MWIKWAACMSKGSVGGRGHGREHGRPTSAPLERGNSERRAPKRRGSEGAKYKQARDNARNQTLVLKGNHLSVPPQALNVICEQFGFSRNALDDEGIKAALATYVHEFMLKSKMSSRAMKSLLRELTQDELVSCLQSIRLFGGVKKASINSLLFTQRMVFDVNRQQISAAMNKAALGCETSLYRSHLAKAAGVLDAGVAQSYEMTVPFKRRPGSRPSFNVTVHTVAAPALDNQQQPDWAVYVDRIGRLKKANYALAMNTLSAQFARGVITSKKQNVGTCAAGLDAFIGGLDESNREKARKIGVTALVNEVLQLRAAGKTVEFMAKSKDDEIWRRVNQTLSNRGEEEVQWGGSVPDGITKEKAETTNYKNAGELSALAGNGNERDPSIDGFYGRSSLLSFVHGLVSIVGMNSREMYETRRELEASLV
jgi:hypothetical protein